jgi:hypothetical protein
MTISRDGSCSEIRTWPNSGFQDEREMFSIDREPARAIRIHLCGADIHSTFTSRTLVFMRCGEAAEKCCRTTLGSHLTPRRIHVNVKRILGFLAIGGLLMLAAPAERAQALSLLNPGAAAAVQDDSKLTTEVRWHRHYGWRRHHWRRHYGWHRHHWRHRHWRRW